VAVDDGVVTLSGQGQDDDTSDEVTDVVKRVEGVRVVMNQMSTDDEVMSGRTAPTFSREAGRNRRACCCIRADFVKREVTR
jgi:osmotically-inducible protein OsmY